MNIPMNKVARSDDEELHSTLKARPSITASARKELCGDPIFLNMVTTPASFGLSVKEVKV